MRGTILTGVFVLGVALAGSGQERPVYLFSSFSGDGDGLHLSWSSDGLNWTALNADRTYVRPTIGGRLMRDPFILRGPDGLFHMVWTSGWWDRVIGYASSRDLVHWSEQRAIPVMMHEPSAKNAWAPEIAYDAERREFVVFWATTIPGRFPGDEAGDRAPDGTLLNHRMYATRTKDFVTFTPTTLFFDPGYSVIDATISRVGRSYRMIFKDETLTPPRKHLRIATAERLAGPYQVVSEAFTPPGVWVEGPSLITIGDYYYCYFDMYRSQRYGAMRSKDLKVWEDVTPQLRFSVTDVRHGTVLPVPNSTLRALLSAGVSGPGGYLTSSRATDALTPD